MSQPRDKPSRVSRESGWPRSAARNFSLAIQRLIECRQALAPELLNSAHRTSGLTCNRLSHFTLRHEYGATMKRTLLAAAVTLAVTSSAYASPTNTGDT